MNNIFEYVDKMEKLIEINQDSKELEDFFYNLAFVYDPVLSDEIKQIDLSNYKEKLKRALLEAIRVAKENSCIAIYFEYDVSQWDGYFYLSKYYVPKAMVDDEYYTDCWTAEWWDEELEGANNEQLSNIYFTNNISEFVQLYLHARTFSILLQIYQETKVSDMAICCGAHDFTNVIRLQEFVPPKDRIFDQRKVKEPERPEVLPLNKLEVYVLTYYHLFLTPPSQPPATHGGYVILPVTDESDPRVWVKKILESHGDQMFINYCPFCGEVRLTPKAKQCLSCHKREGEDD